jgi:hypothetical protein
MDTNKRIARAMLKKSFAEAKELVFKSLYAKASLALDEARYAVANAIFNEANVDEMDEDFQMPERESEMRKKIKNAGKKRSEADADGFEAAIQNVSGPNKEEGHQKFVDANKRRKSAEKQRSALVTKNREERKDTKKVYGKGGKVVGKVEKK